METITNKSQALPNRISLALLGYPKSGKSTIALSFPKPISLLHTDLNHEPAYSMVQSGSDIQINYPDPDPTKGWKDINDWWLQARARKLDAQTLIVDSFGMLQKGWILPRVQDANGSIDQRGWGQILNASLSFFSGLTSVTKQMKGLPSYNLVVICHLVEKKDSSGNTTAERPDIQGSFAANFAASFSTTLYCHSRQKAELVKGVNGLPDRSEKRTVYEAWSVPPNANVDIECGDSFGGTGGRKRLPSTLENPSYLKLCEAWGIQPDPDLPSVFSVQAQKDQGK